MRCAAATLSLFPMAHPRPSRDTKAFSTVLSRQRSIVQPRPWSRPLHRLRDRPRAWRADRSCLLGRRNSIYTAHPPNIIPTRRSSADRSSSLRHPAASTTGLCNRQAGSAIRTYDSVPASVADGRRIKFARDLRGEFADPFQTAELLDAPTGGFMRGLSGPNIPYKSGRPSWLPTRQRLVSARNL